MDTPSQKKDLSPFFGPDKIDVANAILSSLCRGESLPKKKFAGVSVEEVRNAAALLGLDMSG